MKKLLIASTALSFAFVAIPASAATLFALDNGSDTLVSIDTTTNVFTDIGALGTDANFGDLAYGNSTLYMLGGRNNENLYTVDTATGAATLVGNHGIGDLFGLAFDASTGKLYASQFLNGGGFYEIDANTGAATLVGNTGTRIGGMTYRGDTNQLVGTNDGTGDFFGLDPANGDQTLLGGDGFVNNSDLAFDGDLGVYWLLDFSGDFYQYNADTLSRTLISNTGRQFDGLAYTGSIGTMGAVPEPATWAFMIFGFGAIGGAMRRQRKANVKVSYA
ncbi:PEPxxWA-CTERM sorting domain-containing protein [Parasphingorhabdus sp.]|uniref:PEPxxWA-CTERM sorting domain-containing protein n=1 Tax=Parasphingorhabdus sp. TaxID=2709688 RepID=UPI00326782E4